jgi:RecB family exonuclease
VRALPAPERLRLVERILREVADQTPLSPPPAEATPTDTAAAPLPDTIWADVPDDEWDAFTARLRAFRKESWRRIA